MAEHPCRDCRFCRRALHPRSPTLCSGPFLRYLARLRLPGSRPGCRVVRAGSQGRAVGSVGTDAGLVSPVPVPGEAVVSRAGTWQDAPTCCWRPAPGREALREWPLWEPQPVGLTRAGERQLPWGEQPWPRVTGACGTPIACPLRGLISPIPGALGAIHMYPVRRAAGLPVTLATTPGGPPGAAMWPTGQA